MQRSESTSRISPEYQAQIAALHKSDPRWGTSSGTLAGMVQQVIQRTAPLNILDYGCGKQSLSRALPQYRFIGYDPAIPGLQAEPQPCDLVICTDVLEHVEPEKVDAVLDHIQSLTRQALFLTVATKEAIAILPDGRNAHLTIQPYDWWLARLLPRFRMDQFQNGGPGFSALFKAIHKN